MRTALFAALLALALAACGGSSPASTVAPSAVASPAAIAASATPAPTAEPISAPPTAAPTPTVFVSAAYGYQAVFPGGGLDAAPAAAATPWDGVTPIDSGGPLTDKFYRPGSRLLFVYGAPTDLELADYTVEGQRLKSKWRDCEQPETSVATTFAGTPAVLNSFTCLGLRVFSVYVVHEGMGVVINQLTPPGNEAADEAELTELLSGWSWAG
jgi:hypothetical protein